MKTSNQVQVIARRAPDARRKPDARLFLKLSWATLAVPIVVAPFFAARALGAPATPRSVAAKSAATRTVAASKAAASKAATSSVSSGEYRLGPEDVISVMVAGHVDDMSAPQVTVSPSGTVGLPKAGELNVRGKTVGEVKAMVTRRLLRTLKRPRVTVTLVSTGPKQVTVQGSGIEKPGVYDVKNGWRISDALALAGNFKVSANLIDGVLSRGGRNIPFDVSRLQSDSTDASNLLLQPGDTLSFAARTIAINVSGQVQKPGAFDVPIGTDVVEALTFAGGAAEKAALTRVIVKRANGDVVPVDLYNALVKGDKQDLLRLQAGDLIVVPESKSRVTVMGDVPKPGFFDLEDGRTLRLAELLALAGGLGIKPDAMRITLAREGEGGEVQVKNIDPTALLELSDPAQNVALRDGDTISVSPAFKAQTINISGEVVRPGPLEIKESTNPAQLINQAGGPTENAALSRVVVERNGKTFIVNTYATLKNGAPLNFPLQNGDFVVVPKNTTRVLVVQGVNKPGYVALPETGFLSVAEALSEAGGPKDRAKLKEVALLRQTPTGVQRQVIALDKVQNWQVAANTRMINGDVLYVPEKGEGGTSFWQKLQNGAGLLSLFRLF